DGQIHTGRQLWQELLRSGEDLEVVIKYQDLPDAAGFRAAFLGLNDHVRATHLFPVIHIESHGSADGLVLASGELVSWDELVNLLRPINVASRLNLFVSISACYGENLARAINPGAPA